MARSTKKELPVPRIRATLAKNICDLRDYYFSKFPSPTQRNKELARLSKVAASQIQRIIKAELGTSIDYVERLADVFHVATHQLLTPDFSNSIVNPMSVRAPEAEGNAGQSQRSRGAHQKSEKDNSADVLQRHRSPTSSSR